MTRKTPRGELSAEFLGTFMSVIFGIGAFPPIEEEGVDQAQPSAPTLDPARGEA